jgi:hypothetical protein
MDPRPIAVDPGFAAAVPLACLAGLLFLNFDRLFLACVAFAAGTGCIYWSLRRIGQCRWGWMLCGWLLYEAALFTALYGLIWSWGWRWTW